MKRLKYSLGLMFLLLSTNSLLAKDKPKFKEYVKTITEYAAIDNDGTVSIDNQFGTVTVTTSNSGRVDATITITIDTESQTAADEFFDRVYIDMDHSSDHFDLQTSFESPSWWKSIWKSNNHYKYTIDMEVAIPLDCDLEVTNQHGDVYVEDIENDFTLDLSFGKAECNAVGGDCEVDLEHAEAAFTNVQDCTLDIQHGKFKSTSVHDIECDSQFSEINIGEANDVDIVSQYDDYHLGRINTFDNEGQFDDIKIDYVQSADVETQYSDIVIDYLVDSGFFESQFGSLYIKEADPVLSEIDIESQYTQLSLVINSAYILDIESQFGSLNLENDLNITSKDKSVGQHDLEGYYLNDNGNTTVTVEMQFGSFKLRHK